MGEFPEDGSDILLGQLRDRSRLSEENDHSRTHLPDRPQHQSDPTERLTTRRDFFRYSNRQFMILISTLSLCFAVNRNNHIDDLVFVLESGMSPRFLWILLTLVALLLIARAIRKSKHVTKGR